MGQPRVLLPSATINAASLGVLVIVARGGASVGHAGGAERAVGPDHPADLLLHAEPLGGDAGRCRRAPVRVRARRGDHRGRLHHAARCSRRASPRRSLRAPRCWPAAILTLVGTVAFADLRRVAARGGPLARAAALGGGVALAGASGSCCRVGGVRVLQRRPGAGADGLRSRHGSPEVVGPLLSIQAVASMIGGIWYGARRWRIANRGAVSAFQPRSSPWALPRSSWCRPWR